jgi:hypothetical protein
MSADLFRCDVRNNGPVRNLALDGLEFIPDLIDAHSFVPFA